jgi:CBS domain-containing protein
VDVASFLGSHAPFDELTPIELDGIVQATDIVFSLKGEVIMEAGGPPVEHAYVIRTGSVELLDEGHVVDLQREGEVIGALSLLSGERPLFTARASEETICYRIERRAATAAFASPGGVSFLGRMVRRRERTLLEHADVVTADPWTAPLGVVSVAEVLTIASERTIREAAQRMTEAHASSILVDRGGGWAIVTDRDLRARALAEGIDDSEPVDRIASAPLVSLPFDATAAEALALMLELGIHHVPVSEAGRIRGIVTDTDLMALERRSALRLRRAIGSAGSTADAIAAARGIPGTLADLVSASVDPLAVGHLAGVFHDALTVRLIDLAVARLGAAPCPWGWLALGSQARHEQGLETDQDHALVYGTADIDDAYFAELAEEVTSGLERAGIPRCRAGVVAAARPWRGSIEEWRGRFAEWARDREPVALGKAAIVFDHRWVAGPPDLGAAFGEALVSAGRAPGVQRRLARWVVDQRPPRGFLRSAIVEARGTSDVVFDVKRQGISPITSIARVLALRAQVPDNRTVARIRASSAAGLLEQRDAQALEEAFRLLWQVRLDHQAAQVRGGTPPDDQVDPRRLGPLARQGLKEAFRRIETAQQVLALEMGLR